MEPVTLIATDLDGTFLNSKKQVSDINREAISKLKNYGILFGIASGRPVETVRAMLKKSLRLLLIDFRVSTALSPAPATITGFDVSIFFMPRGIDRTSTADTRAHYTII